MLLARKRDLQRGQALTETLIVLPVAIFAIFAILYIARAGIVNERIYLSMRYAGFSAFYGQSNQAYTAADIYSNIQGGNQPVPCPKAPAGAFNDTAPYPGPSGPPLWNPDEPVTSQCSMQTTSIGGASFLASRYLSATLVNVQTGVNVPPYLQSLIPAQTTMQAQGGFVHPAYPGVIMYCNGDTFTAVYDSLTSNGTISLPTPMPGEPTPGPTPGPGDHC